MLEIIDTYTVGQLRLRIFADNSLDQEGCANFPIAKITIPEGDQWAILGGGAFVDWDDNVCTPLGSPGNLLAEMYSENRFTWVVSSRDHIKPNNAIITGFCIAAQMQDGTPISDSDYMIVDQRSNPPHQSHPSAHATLPNDFVLVGGGASTQLSDGGAQLLYKSVPDGKNGWFAASKDHIDSNPGSVVAFAIGLHSSFLQQQGLTVVTQQKTTPNPAHHPWVSLVIPDFHLVGGGAEVNWAGAGNLLTASFPQDRQTWIARGKDHISDDPATITAFAIGLMETRS